MRQQHGKDFENKIIKDYKLRKELKRTHEWDAYGGLESLRFSDEVIINKDDECNIKCYQQGSRLMMADFRKMANKQKDFFMFVGIHEQRKKKVNVYQDITSAYIVKVLVEKLRTYFPRWIFNEHNVLSEDFMNMYNYCCQDICKHMEDSHEIQEFYDLYHHDNPVMKLSPKCSQKRFQASIKHEDVINTILKDHPNVKLL